jgi:hypothetical protein
MKRIALLLTMATIMAVTTIALSGVAFAASNQPEWANDSCFGDSESSSQQPPGPGAAINGLAQTTTPPATQLIPILQQGTHSTCQEIPPDDPGNPERP